jgi:hypothetical protein
MFPAAGSAEKPFETGRGGNPELTILARSWHYYAYCVTQPAYESKGLQ